MQTNETKVIKDAFLVQKDRIFVDISSEGCGSGCLYCYVKTKNAPQKLLSQSQIESLCTYISANNNCKGKIISLCPNTEPLKSKQSINLVLWIVKYFLDLGSYVQISTKEYVPDWVLNRLKEMDFSRVFLNVSVPFLHNCEIIEPYAATVEKRLDIFRRENEIWDLNLCLYIKPFGRKPQSEIEEYIRIINQYKITRVCVGINFTKDSCEENEWPCAILYHRSLAAELMADQKQEMNNFITQLRQCTSARIYCSSVCCINQKFDRSCELQLFHVNEVVCENCSRKFKE